ncbi:unnamed protein product [Caenorhabditis angaria]|uniref:Protein kinase domain-containing protein n=1 Tax=Caenorhabditis angaria TaxID=860376 RepID=A0A9P1MWB8_9PELO|nr:unnamed protein product [Caenorhabditis angaria]
MRRNARIEDIKRQSTITIESWNTETNTSTTSVTPSTTSTILTSNAVIPIAHRLVTVKGPYIGFKKCCECRKYLIYYTMKKEDIYVCQVCGVRVHGGCVDRITNNCVMTSQYVGGLVQNAIIRKNKTKWDPTCHTAPCSSPSSPLSPASLLNVNSSPKYKFDEEDDEERQMTWEDVTIKQKDVIIKGRIGEGRFGVVHFGVYHGDAAIKFVNMNYVEEESRNETFKSEVVAAYKNSRHDHIALFLGYFSNPITNTFAIVTNYYHGDTLFNRLHESNEEIEMNWIFNISLQICQAMSYLHTKNILHKDLRTKKYNAR